jgi:hypothetical protein
MRLTRVTRTAGIRWRPVFFVTGALLMVFGLALPGAAGFVPGMLILALSVPDGRPHSPTTAMVRAWVWLHQDRAGRP